MKFAYEDLSDDQFEKLIVLLSQELFGISVQGFAKGPDGGRDAKFIGKAQFFPSKADPWIGTTIIQAKHCNGFYRSFSESDFFSNTAQNTVIGKEVIRIKQLFKNKHLDHYILFANRRLPANTETDIRAYISKFCGISEASIYLCDIEQLELWLKQFPKVPEMADLDPVDSPLIVSPDDLAEVVQALAQYKKNISALIDDPPTPRVNYDDKNKINNMSVEYGKALRTRYLKETGEIYTFLASPENIDYLRMYELIVDEFQLKIIAKRKRYQNFDEVMEHLIDLLFGRDPVLRQRKHKRLVRAVLFYMYWNCDLGETENAKAH